MYVTLGVSNGGSVPLVTSPVSPGNNNGKSPSSNPPVQPVAPPQNGTQVTAPPGSYQPIDVLA
jgi:hypothetical protein